MAIKTVGILGGWKSWDRTGTISLKSWVRGVDCWLWIS